MADEIIVRDAAAVPTVGTLASADTVLVVTAAGEVRRAPKLAVEDFAQAEALAAEIFAVRDDAEAAQAAAEAAQEEAETAQSAAEAARDAALEAVATDYIVAEEADLAALTPTTGQTAWVRATGHFWTYDGSAWQNDGAGFLDAKVSIEAATGDATSLADDRGYRAPGTPTVHAHDGVIEAPSLRLAMGLTDGDALRITLTDERLGYRVILAEPNADPLDEEDAGSTADALFTAAQYADAEAEAAAEALRLNSQDVSGFARWTVDSAAAFDLHIGTGQSFMAGSGQAHLFLTTSRLALLGLADLPAVSVGPDSRCVSAGATYTTFGGGSLTLTPLAEHFIYPTGTDAIYTDTEAATGDYAVNARGGTPETPREAVWWTLRNAWAEKAHDFLPAVTSVAMNHAKTDGSIAEVGGGDGLLRMYSLIDVFVSATTGSRLCTLIDLNHGEADEAAGTATYKADVEAFYDNIWANLQLDLSQTDPPAMLMQQVGGPRYGTAAMVAANAQVDMMVDLTGTTANIFLVGAKYEVPSFYFLDQAEFTGFPNDAIWDNNGHPTLAGNVLMGIRSGVAAHYIHDRQEPYWIPFPFKVYYEEDRFLVLIPCKFPPLRAVPMVCGVTTHLLASLGITFENGGGTENPVTFARVVEGYSYLIEGRCEQSIAGFTTFKTGKRTGPLTISGFTNIRDSFDIELPFELPFTQRQTYFPGGGRDDPALNGLGRFLEAIPGWVGEPDLGNPCARRTLTATPIPV